MSNKYVLIENPGTAPVEAFTLLGASNKAGSDAIGQFGSGAKFGPLLLLRKELPPVIYSGLTRIEYGTEPVVFDGAEHQRVYINLSGKKDGKAIKRREDLSLVLRYGELDWKDEALAAREFVSNALDAVNGQASDVKVSIVEGAPRARDGFTRVYIPVSESLEQFVADLHKWFLHFTSTCNVRDSFIILKTAPSPARIYRRGVFVREVGENSLFDYNCNDLPLDEARVASDYHVAYYAARLLQFKGTPSHIAALLLAEKVWEHSFNYSLWTTPKEEESRQHAFKAGSEALGDDVVFAAPSQDAVLAERKGYRVRRVAEEVYNALVKSGARTTATILTTDEREGRRVDAERSPWVYDLVARVWDKLAKHGFTREEKFPEVRTYSQDLTAGGKTLGYYRDNTVYLNNCLLPEDHRTLSPELFSTILEELAHHITKATDNSRDFQEYFIQIATKLLAASI